MDEIVFERSRKKHKRKEEEEEKTEGKRKQNEKYSDQNKNVIARTCLWTNDEEKEAKVS